MWRAATAWPPWAGAGNGVPKISRSRSVRICRALLHPHECRQLLLRLLLLRPLVKQLLVKQPLVWRFLLARRRLRIAERLWFGVQTCELLVSRLHLLEKEHQTRVQLLPVRQLQIQVLHVPSLPVMNPLAIERLYALSMGWRKVEGGGVRRDLVALACDARNLVHGGESFARKTCDGRWLRRRSRRALGQPSEGSKPFVTCLRGNMTG